jgi:hypothetical protein
VPETGAILLEKTQKLRNVKWAGITDKVAIEFNGRKARSILDRYDIVDEGDISNAAAKLKDYFARRNKARVAKLERVK